MATKPEAAVDRLKRANGAAYNPVTNPDGLAVGGHRVNWEPDMQAVADTAEWTAATAEETAVLRQAVADDKVATAGSAAGAAQSASASAGSASAAAGSATAAAASFDAFDDRYLGAKAADPSVDNDGNALVVGALVLNTTANVMKVWNGAAWQVLVPAAADYTLKTRQIATGTGLTGGGDLSADRSISVVFPTQAEAEAGVNATKPMSALRTAQAIAAQTPVAGLVFLSAQTVTSAVASVVFTGIDSAFDEYVLDLVGIVPSAGSDLRMTFSTDNGANFFNSDYVYNSLYVTDTSSIQSSRSANFSHINLSAASVSSTLIDGGFSGSVKLFSPSAIRKCSIQWSGIVSVNSSFWQIQGVARNEVSNDVDAIRFNFGSGNIASGTFKLYGLRKS